MKILAANIVNFSALKSLICQLIYSAVWLNWEDASTEWLSNSAFSLFKFWLFRVIFESQKKMPANQLNFKQLFIFKNIFSSKLRQFKTSKTWYLQNDQNIQLKKLIDSSFFFVHVKVSPNLFNIISDLVNLRLI